MNPQVTSTVWKENVRLADENNHPGKFTAFGAGFFGGMLAAVVLICLLDHGPIVQRTSSR